MLFMFCINGLKYFSLRNAASSDAVMKELQGEVEKVIQTRLQEIGVSSGWKGLPKRSFQQAMTIVNHQASLTQKVCITSWFKKMSKF